MDNQQNSSNYQYAQGGEQQYQQQQQQYQQYQPVNNGPVAQLKTNRSLLKIILLSMITFGIYGLVVYCGVSNAVNTVAGRYDGKRTMHFALLAFLIGPITFGIGYVVWYHKISARIGDELVRRNIAYSFDASSYWLWAVLGSLIAVGPFIYIHKLLKATNLICESYNTYG